MAQILDLTVGVGVDAAIDCAGDPAAQRLLIDATRRNGSIAFVGESGDLSIGVSDDLIRNGLTLHGIWHYNLNGVAKLMQLAQRCGDQLDKLITHTFPLDQVQDAWDLKLSRQCGKVVLHP